MENSDKTKTEGGANAIIGKQRAMDEALNRAAEEADDKRKGSGDRVGDEQNVSNRRDHSEKRSGRSKH